MTETQSTNEKEIAELIVKAIKDEPFFDEKMLLTKIESIIKVFKLDLTAERYNKILNPTETAQLIRTNELNIFEKKYWFREFRKVIGKKAIVAYTEQWENKLKAWNSEN